MAFLRASVLPWPVRDFDYIGTRYSLPPSKPSVGTESLSFGTVAVLHAVAAGYRFGFDIVDATGLAAGSACNCRSRRLSVSSSMHT